MEQNKMLVRQNSKYNFSSANERELMCSVVGSPGGRELVMKLYQKNLAA